MNTVSAIKEILFTDLNSLNSEIKQYGDETTLWKVIPGTTNSAGVLFVHLTRSLRHFIGSSFADSGYLRQRDEEFAAKDIPLDIMLKESEVLKSELEKAFNNIENNKLDSDFPVTWREGLYYPTHFMLMRMIAHVNYHMGQINYHRRFFHS